MELRSFDQYHLIGFIDKVINSFLIVFKFLHDIWTFRFLGGQFIFLWEDVLCLSQNIVGVFVVRGLMWLERFSYIAMGLGREKHRWKLLFLVKFFIIQAVFWHIDIWSRSLEFIFWLSTAEIAENYFCSSCLTITLNVVLVLRLILRDRIIIYWPLSAIHFENPFEKVLSHYLFQIYFRLLFIFG